jgi:hypothetical protein
LNDTIFTLFWFEFYCYDSTVHRTHVQTTSEKQQCLALPAIVDTCIPLSRFKARGKQEIGDSTSEENEKTGARSGKRLIKDDYFFPRVMSRWYSWQT